MSNSKIRERVRRLREKTTARGCTEAEAIAAAEKAAELMRDYAISEADILFDAQRSRSGRGYSVKAKLWGTIAVCTNTAHVVISEKDCSAVEFIGREPGPEIAVYLRDVCERAIDRAVREFRATPFYRKRRTRKARTAAGIDFIDAMVNRLRFRLIEVFAAVRNSETHAEAQTALRERYRDLIEIEHRKAPLRYNDAREAGWKAGDQVALSHGVGSTDAPLAIGGRA